MNFSRNRIFYKIFFGYLILLLSLNISLAQTFDVDVKGIYAGKASLVIDKNNAKYDIVLRLVPNFLVRTFGISDITEHVNGIIKNDKYLPIKYSRISGKKLELEATFADDKVNIISNGKSHTQIINVLAQDPLTQILQIKTDLMNHDLKLYYYLINSNDVTKYQSSIKTNASNTLQTELKEINKNRKITIIFDKKFNLIELDKTKDNKIEFKLKSA